jgi:hypothetical protein
VGGQIEVIKPRFGNYSSYGRCWYIRYGNIATVSYISREKCLEKHIKKLLKLGYSEEEINRHF